MSCKVEKADCERSRDNSMLRDTFPSYHFSVTVHRDSEDPKIDCSRTLISHVPW